MIGLAVVVTACGGGGSSVEFDEDAVVVALREGWPGVSDDELRDNQAQVFRDACTHDPDDRAASLAFAMSLDTDTRRILEAGCPEVVARYDD